MNAEIISVGTELLLGEIVDSNAAFVGRELAARGVTLHRKATVGDNVERLAAVIREALSRADLIVLGGGLGPTEDDLTREALAMVAGETPSEDPQLLAWLENLYASRGRVMPQLNRKQAWLIPSAQALPNPNGTAPGWLLTLPAGHPHAGKRLAALPGPPREMQRMFSEELLPRLKLPEWAFHAVTLHTSGIGESNVAELLAGLTTTANPSVATYARRSGTDVRVAASAQTLSEAQALAAPVLDQVRAALQRFIWAEEGPGSPAASLPQAIAALLGERQLAIVETGSGVLSAQFAGVHGQGALALRGAAISSDHAILLTLGLTPVTLGAQGLVSSAAALELARGAREQFGAAVGLSVCTAEGDHTGQTWAAVVGEGWQETASVSWPGDAAQMRERAASSALNLAFKALKAHT